MQDLVSPVSIAIDQLLGRASGPMHARLIMQPLMASFLAIRAGIRDARAGDPAFFWSVLTNKEERRILLQSGWKDISKIFGIAVLLDTVYQIVALREFSLLQTLIVAIAVAVIPYTIVRGPANRIVRAMKPAEKPAEVS